jgi:hypothetical protein
MTDSLERVPSTNEYVIAFQSLKGLTAKQVAMLTAHYNAPDRTITAPELAVLFGYKAHSIVNAQYGTLARKIGGLLRFKPLEVYP